MGEGDEEAGGRGGKRSTARRAEGRKEACNRKAGGALSEPSPEDHKKAEQRVRPNTCGKDFEGTVLACFGYLSLPPSNHRQGPPHVRVRRVAALGGGHVTRAPKKAEQAGAAPFHSRSSTHLSFPLPRSRSLKE